MIFDDPLQGGAAGTTHLVTVFPTHVMLTNDASHVKYKAPAVPAACGTVSLGLRIERGCEGSEVISDGYLKAPDGIWPTFSVSLQKDAGSGKYVLGLHYWTSSSVSNWRSLWAPPALVPGIWYQVGVTWGQETETEKGMAIWVDGVRQAYNGDITDPHQHPVQLPFACWGLGNVDNSGAPLATCHSLSVRCLRVYDTIEDYGGTKQAPTLAWVGTPGYESDGVNPDQGAADKRFFVFRVKYLDVGDDPAAWVTLSIERNGTLVKPCYGMRAISGTPAAGQVWSRSLTLPGGTYRYRFAATDHDGRARGQPTAWKSGPLVVGGSSLTSVGLGSMTCVPTPGGGAQVTFSLTAPATIEAAVVNLAGRPVRVLCRAQPRAAGTNALLWDGRNDAGLDVPGGAYLIEVTARGSEGDQARALAPLHLQR